MVRDAVLRTAPHREVFTFREKHMPAILLSAPAVEPVTLDEARAFLRVEHNDDDEVIAALAAGSRIHVEAQRKRALITRSWRITAG